MAFFDKFKSNNNEDKKETIIEDFVYFLPNTFDPVLLAQDLLEWAKKDKNWEVSILNTTSYPIFQYRPPVKIGSSSVFHLKLAQKNNQLHTLIYENEVWVESHSTNEGIKPIKGNWLNDSYEKELRKKIEELILKQFRLMYDGRMIEPITSNYLEKIALPSLFLCYTFLKEGEMIFSLLNASHLEESSVLPKDNSLFFIITNERTLLVSHDDKLQNTWSQSFETKETTVVDKLGKDLVTIGEFQFWTQIANDFIYRDLVPALNCSGEQRIQEIVLLHLHNKESKTEEYQAYIRQLIAYQQNTYPTESYYTFCAQIISFFTPYHQIAIGEENEKLISEIFVKFLADSEAGAGAEKLIQWLETWKLPANVLPSIIEILNKLVEDVEIQKKYEPLYTKAYIDYREQEKDEDKRLIFELAFADYLAKIDQRERAVEIYEKIYQNLPDETLADILVPPTIDIQAGEGGQQLTVSVLEKMIEAKGDKDIPDAENTQRLACLQPLVQKNLNTLQQVANENLKEKAGSVLEILTTGKLAEEDKDANALSYEVLKKEVVDFHVNSQHSKGGLFDSMQELLASTTIPDQSVVKSFAERVGVKNYPWLQEMIIDMTYALNMPTPEVYIARGDNSSSIKGFEDSIPFILVGINYLEEESEFYLTPEELRFALAVEIAHLYFGHSRITSSDVWRGAMDKGMFVLNTILAVVPGISAITSNFDKLTRITSLLNKVDSISDKVKGITETVDGNLAFTKEQEKERELLAISRLMELIADRLAVVLVKGNLALAIRSLLVTNPKYATEMITIQKYGLEGMLAKKDANGNFIYQELSIRIHGICSFYLSEDYEAIAKTI